MINKCKWLFLVMLILNNEIVSALVILVLLAAFIATIIAEKEKRYD